MDCENFLTLLSQMEWVVPSSESLVGVSSVTSCKTRRTYDTQRIRVRRSTTSGKELNFGFCSRIDRRNVFDIHCHILPEVDDGPKSWDAAQEMCRMAVTDGIMHIVATPHANNRYHYDRDYLSGLLEHLRGLVGDAPELSLGCDFHLSYENLQDVLASPERYVIGNTNYLLVELSNY